MMNQVRMETYIRLRLLVPSANLEWKQIIQWFKWSLACGGNCPNRSHLRPKIVHTYIRDCCREVACIGMCRSAG